jgi:hypothetical protein
MAIPSKVIWPTYEAYEQGYQIICNEGGSRSGKSYSTIQILVSIATTQKKNIYSKSFTTSHKKGSF